MWVDQVVNNRKIEVIYNTEIVGLEGLPADRHGLSAGRQGEEKLENIILSAPYQGKKKIAVDGLFVEIGVVPLKILIKQLALETDKNGYIKVDAGQKTSRSGIWAAGDITTASNGFRQIVTACGEGAVAVESIFKFLQEKKK